MRSDRPRLNEAQRLRAVIAAQRDIAVANGGGVEIMQLITERAQQLTTATAAAVELVEGDDMVYRAVSGSAVSSIGLRLRRSASLSGRCVETGETVSSRDTYADPRVDREACTRIGARSMVVVPLVHEARTIGVLKVMSSEQDAFDTEDITLLELMAGLIAAALDRAEAQDALRDSEDHFRALAQTAKDGIVTIDDAGIIKFWNSSAEEMFGYRAEERIGLPLDEIMPERFRSMHRAGLARYVAGGEARVVGRTVELTAQRRDGSEFPIELSIGTWRARDRRFFTGVIRDVTDRKRDEARLLAMARTDILTGLLTRRAGEEELARESSRETRYATPLSFALIDVDHFKRVNDVHGHGAGDDVLRVIGAILRQAIRPSDAGVRWGGEEFLLLLPHTTEEGARACAERIRMSVASTDFVRVGRVTISTGVAQSRDDEDCAAAIARADTRLYQAKASGRNRVI